MVVSPGSLADSLKREAKRLAGFREADVRVINRAGVDGKHL
jgi:hypothetical protein